MPSTRRDLTIMATGACLPLLLYVFAGYGGHDFSFHAASWLELHRAWVAREWHPGWSSWAHYGFGEPRFSFYPPISIYVGTAISFLLPFRWVPAAMVWLIFTLSGLSMYQAAAYFYPAQGRLRAALLYMFNPYLLLTVVIRFAIAEAWVQAVLPLVLLYFMRTLNEKQVRPFVAASCLLAVCWLANIPEAIGVFYAFALLSALLALRSRSMMPVLLGAGIQVVGLLLSAAQLLPTLVEKQWITASGLLIYQFRNFMQLRRVPPPHLPIYECTAYLVLALALALPALRQVRKGQARPNLLPACITLGAFAIVFQLPVTTPLWEHLPQFKFILFPYRLLAFLSVALVLLLCHGGVSARLRKLTTLGFACLALVTLFAYTRLLPMQRFSSLNAATTRWQQGYEGVREYVPAVVSAAVAEPESEAERASEGPFHGKECAPTLLKLSPEERQIQTDSASNCMLTLNTYYYPSWKATLDHNVPIETGASGEGLLQVPVTAGRHQVRLAFVTGTAVRLWSSVLSAVTFVLLMLSLRLPKSAKPASLVAPAPPAEDVFHSQRERHAS